MKEKVTAIFDIGKTNIRVGAVQWQMRSVDSVEELISQVEYFVDTVSEYQSDFILFPEFFNAPLMQLGKDESQTESIRYLASFTDAIREAMSRLALEYNANIITGSMPMLENGNVYNVAYLCHRDGKIDMQRKIHITPHEKKDWVMQGGDKVSVFETDAGRIGILICYDVELTDI